MRLLAACLAIWPGLLSAGGLAVIVEMPCYPEDKFHICRVPVVDGHYPGYLPRTVPSHVRLAPGDPIKRTLFGPPVQSLDVFVTPNLVPYYEAVQDAAMVFAAQCGRQGQEAVVARITERYRYAPEDVESWKFTAVCD